MKKTLLLVLALPAWGCAGLSKTRGHREVAELVKERTGQETGWSQGSPEEAQVTTHVEALLKGGLTPDRAVAIALINNPALQATYEGLGVSQADLVQAGLLSNPSLSGSVGFPATSGGRIEYEASIVQSFLDLFVLPARKRIARQQFQADIQRVAHEALGLVAQVRQAFARLQAGAQRVVLQRTVVEVARMGAELAQRQFEAGNVNDLVLAAQQVSYQQTRLDLAAEELEWVERREALHRLLGLSSEPTAWTPPPLPEPPERELPLDRLEDVALQQRLDVDAARKQTLLLENALGLAKTSRFLGLIEVGVHAHQDPDGPRLFGPTLSLELPIFDQRQAMIGRLEAQKRQAERTLKALSVDARSEVRVARAQLLNARRVVESYRTELLPLRERVLEHSQRQYNAMQSGLYVLLDARQQQAEAYRGYIDALLRYWSARAELERVVGGRIGEFVTRRGVENGSIEDTINAEETHEHPTP